MNKNALGFFGIAFLLLICAGCRAENPTWDRIEESGLLRVGLDPTYPPFEVADGDNVNGLDVDLARAIAANLALDTEFVYFGYDGLYDALATNQADVLISALVIAPERTRDFAYSDPYFNAGEILIVPADEVEIIEMADLNGRILAVELGALGHVEANVWANRLPDLTILPLSSVDEALTAVVEGQADAALVDAINGRLFLSTQPKLKRIPTPVTVEPFAIVTRNEDELLLEKINQSLETLKQSGELDEIIRRWLD